MEAVSERKRTRKIPEALIYDLIDGKPYYRKGYKSVLNKTQTLESIMGCSGLQATLIEYLMEIFFGFPERKKYHFFTNEPGLHLDLRNNLAGDVCLYKRSDVPTASKLAPKYLTIPPLVQVEVDVSIDLSDNTEVKYITNKANKLLDFGVGKVIWIFTASQNVLIATTGQPWQMMDWHTDVELLPGLSINIGRFIDTIGEEQTTTDGK
jgi:hypothetical protein